MNPSVKILQPTGLFGGTYVTTFRQEIQELVAAGTVIVLVDCQNISFMDSSGLGALVVALKMLRAADGELFLCSLSKQIKMLFEMASMDQVFRVLANQREFEQTVVARLPAD